MTRWPVVRLGDVGTWLSGGTPTTTNSDYWGGDLPWMSAKSLTEFNVTDSDRRLTAQGAAVAKIVPRDTILMVVRGMSLKSEFRMGITRREVAISQDLKAVRPREGIEPTYLAYALRARTSDVLDMVDEAGHGTGRLQTDRLYSLEILVPPLREQRAIAATIGAFDDKIESNRRAVELISDLITAEFGRVIGQGEPSFVPLGELTDVVKGRSYKSAELAASSTALVTLKSIDRNGGYKPDGLKPYTGPFKPNQEIQPGEIVVAQTDLTQGAEVVGRGVRVPGVRNFDILVASLDLAIVRPKDDLPTEYLLGLLTSDSFRQWCRSRVTGTTVLHLAKDAIPTWPAPLVSRRAQEKYSVFARDLLARMDSLEAEVQRLAALRDALLPELLAGRIRVPSDEHD